MELKKKDFVEIQFTGRIKDGDIFDSNIKEDLAEANIQGKDRTFIFCLGEGMFLPGIDNFLIGKDIGEYNVELKPEDAFGKRDPKLIQMVPIKNFIEHQINPIPGAMFNFDGKLAKILTVSGGRVMVDFNNPIAGRDVEYKIKILNKIDDQKKQIDALNDFFFRKELKFEIKDKKLILEMPKGMEVFAQMFKDKYKDILGLDLETKVEEKKVPVKKETTASEEKKE